MSVLIEGMEMPKEGFVEILIRDDGTVQQTGQSYRIGGTDYYTPYVGEMPVMYKAAPVPPHGGLIEKNTVFKLIQSMPFVDKLLPVEFMKALQEIPTVIPAEEE